MLASVRLHHLTPPTETSRPSNWLSTSDSLHQVVAVLDVSPHLFSKPPHEVPDIFRHDH